MSNENTFHVIKDPVHGTIQFTSNEDKWVKPFINSAHFQRLRHIKQQGMGDYIFPGAVHTRFNHSLGCCYVASQIAHKIGLPDADRQLVMIAGLLHDIGHGPFSHAFEDVFSNKLIRHEEWTPLFLAEFRTEAFFSEYNRINPKFPLTDEKFKQIEAMIMHKPSATRLLADIVSSQLDADRLDYLLRDSHFCGVTYGQFDFRWMLNCMCIIPTSNGDRLGITYKGVGAVEHYLMARRLMIQNIYIHPKKLALEYFLIQLLNSLAENLDDFDDEIKSKRLGQFLLFVNRFNKKILSSNNIENDKANFLQENFADYKELCDYDVFSIIRTLVKRNSHHPAVQLANRIQYRQIPKICKLENVDLDFVREELNAFKTKYKNDFQSWQLAIIKSPHQSYNHAEDPILVRTAQSSIKPLDELSVIVQAISDKFESSAFLSIDIAIAEDPRVRKLIESILTKAITTA